jgi:hypothetical protein
MSPPGRFAELAPTLKLRRHKSTWQAAKQATGPTGEALESAEGAVSAYVAFPMVSVSA